MIGSTQIIVGDVRQTLASIEPGSVQSCITSPPYWGLRSYGGDAGMIGLEPTWDDHLANLLDVFRLVRGALHDTGTVWLNYGDAYAGTGSSGGGVQCERWEERGDTTHRGKNGGRWKSPQRGLKQGDLQMLPHRLAVALQDDGWLVRSAIVWAKGVSFCPTYDGKTMPDSVNGWRWERCRVKVRGYGQSRVCKSTGHDNPTIASLSCRASDGSDDAIYHACPGCDKCRDTDGLVLRRGSWRPTAAYEMVFLLAKGPGYFCDAEAVREEAATTPNHAAGVIGGCPLNETSGGTPTNTRNPRNVWTIQTQPFHGTHFATFPPALVRPMIDAGTPGRGVCSACGMPWARVVVEGRATLGWRPCCTCDADARPATVLDPFAGAGTTLMAAAQMGRDAIGCEINEQYAAMATDRIGKAMKPGRTSRRVRLSKNHFGLLDETETNPRQPEGTPCPPRARSGSTT